MTQEVIEEVVVEDKRLGRHVNHDPRSRRFVYQSDTPITSPLVTVEHNINLSLLDQGSIGACVAYTGTAYLAFDKVWNTLPSSVRSSIHNEYAIQLYRDITRVDPFEGAWEPDDTGSDGLTLAKVLKGRGLISGYVHTFDPASALQALQTQPLAIGIEWLSGCDNPDSNGLVSYSGRVRGGHEILVVGYNAEKQLLKIRNSWGPYWGLKGHFFMTVADFTRAIDNYGDVIILTPLSQPAPTPIPIYEEVDLKLVAAMDPWSKGIISRITKAGKASQAYKAWKEAKGIL